MNLDASYATTPTARKNFQLNITSTPMQWVTFKKNITFSWKRELMTNKIFWKGEGL